MNLLSINIRGIGCENKRDWIKEMKVKEKIFFIAIQETKSMEVSGKLDKVIWGNDNFASAVVDPIGFSGGIASIWDTNLFKVSNIIKEVGFLAVYGIWAPSNKLMWIVNVYAPQTLSQKRRLWYKLENLISTDPSVPWVLCGDYNSDRSTDERLGSSFCPYDARAFNEFIFSSGLIEPPHGGRKFSYMTTDCGKHSLLDRFLLSYNFLTNWPDANAFILPRLFSDHCPVKLSVEKLDYVRNLYKFHDTLSKLEKEGCLSAEELVFAEEARKKLDAIEVEYRQESEQVGRKVLSSDWEIPSEEGQLEQVFVAFKENVLVGSVSIDQKVQITGISENPAIAEISDLVVDVDHRREGIGKLLLERALMEARIWKVSFVTCMLSPYNIAAVNFFRKNDFKKEMSGSSANMILELPHLP